MNILMNLIIVDKLLNYDYCPSTLRHPYTLVRWPRRSRQNNCTGIRMLVFCPDLCASTRALSGIYYLDSRIVLAEACDTLFLPVLTHPCCS